MKVTSSCCRPTRVFAKQSKHGFALKASSLEQAVVDPPVLRGEAMIY